MSPWKTSLMRKMAAVAPASVMKAPVRECESEMSKGSPNIPAKMLPPAMAAVTEEENPARRRPAPKTIPAVFPRRGLSVASACARSVTTVPLE